MSLNCEMCGQERKLVLVKVEKANMNVCSECASSGTKIFLPKQKKHLEMATSPEEFVVNDFSSILRESREKKGLKQEEVAKRLAIKESIIHKLETGNFTPSLRMAKRLEKFYGIKLTEELNEPAVDSYSSKTEEMTLADMMKG